MFLSLGVFFYSDGTIALETLPGEVRVTAAHLIGSVQKRSNKSYAGAPAEKLRKRFTDARRILEARVR